MEEDASEQSQSQEGPARSQFQPYGFETIQLHPDLEMRTAMHKYNALFKAYRQANHACTKLQRQLDNIDEQRKEGCSSQCTDASSLTATQQKQLEILNNFVGTCEDLKGRLFPNESSHHSSLASGASSHESSVASDASLREAESDVKKKFAMFKEFVDKYDFYEESNENADQKQQGVKQAINDTMEASFLKEIAQETKLYKHDMSSRGRLKTYNLGLSFLIL